MLIAAFLAALFLLPAPALAAFAACLAAVAGSEWARLCGVRGAQAWAYGALCAGAYAAVLWAGEGAWRLAFVAAGGFWLVAVPGWLWRGVGPGDRQLLLPAGFLAIVPAALALALLHPVVVLGVLALVSIADSAAFFTGRAWGRRKLAPSISPGKTWEGAAGGLAGALAYAIICGAFIEDLRWAPYVSAAILLGVLGIVGDLFESAAKRQAGVKDSGTLLPGHGGVLDRIDSAVAALPVAALLLPYLGGQA